MNTEITDTMDSDDEKSFRGWIFYDGHCRLCSSNVRLMLAHHGWHFLPLQDPRVAALLEMPVEELQQDFRLLTHDDRQLSGADAYIHVFGTIWWLLPLHYLCRLPLLKQLTHAVYRLIARNRYRIAGRCELRLSEFKPRKEG